MELIALIVLIVLALALYGFIQLLIPIFSNSTSATEDDTSRQTGRQRELRDLSTAAKTIRQFLVWEMIDESEAEPVLRCIEERKEVLTERPRRPAKLTVPIDSSPSAKLKQLFHDCKDVRTLTPANQNLALILSSGLSYEELKQLPPGVLHHLGELFELVNRDRDALRVYRLLLESHPEYQNGVTVALSGAQLAKAHDNSELTNWFLNYLSRQELTAEQSFSVLELEANPEEEPVQVPILIEEHVQETPSTEEPTVEPEPIAEVPKPPAKPETPARSWSDTLAGFMEEKNILWGELVGGLLIVGCSIALVITLWQTLERIPYFPFLVFSTISLALFGAGKYTLHHWKLESTSRGLLLISTLLLPLNLLVLTGLSQGRSGGVLEIITAVGGTFVFAWMAISAGRTLTPALQSWLSLGVVGTAAMQLPIPFFPSWITSSQITFLALAPVLCMAIAVIMATNRTQSRVKEDTAPISTLYLFLGLAFFSLMIVLGLIISRGVNLRLMLQRLSLSFSLAGVPFVLSGLTLLRQLSKADQSPDLQEQRGQSLLIVTSIAFAGMLVMIVATLLAFPVPVLVLIIGLLNAASLSWLAFRTNFPPVHCAAIFCLTLAYFALFALGTPALTMTEFLELVNSTRQVGLVLGLLVIAEILLHRGARQHALYFAWSVLIVGAGAFAYLVKQRYPDLTTIGTMSLLYAALTGFSAIRWKQLWLGYLAHGLTLLGITTFVADSYPNEPYLWSLPLACHSLLLAIVALRASPVWHWPLTQPCRTIAVLSGLLSLIVILPALGESNVVLLLTPLLLGISTLCLVWNYEWSPGTWLAGVLFWLAFSHLYTHDLPANWVPLPTAASFLSLSALTLIGQQFIRHRAERAQSLFAKPFEGITIVGTIGALLILIGNLHESLILLAVYLTIIALLWLTISVQQQSAAWWAGFQSAIFGVVLLFTTDWLHHQEWAEWPWSFFDSRIWHTYAIALTFACILWSILAWSLRNQARIITLMRPSWRMIDQWIADGLLAFQALFVLSRLIPALAQELLPSEIDFGAFATSTDWHGATAWTFFGLLFLLFVLRLWSPQTRWTLHRLLLLALTLPFILTGNRLGTASLSQGLRWSLALTFLLLSVVFWARDIIRKWAEKLRISEQDISLITARSLLSGVCMGPVLLLTLALSPTAFELVDYGLPILVVIVTLVGHALRESDSEFAFAAGLILVVFVPLGHLLHSLQLTDSWTLIESVRLVRLGALMSGSWALLWLSTRRWQKVWNEPSQLMTIQIGITVAGLTILLCSGLFSIVLGMSSTIGHALTAEVGALWSWLTVTVTLGAWVLRHEQRGLVISWNGVGVIALGLVGFLSCTVDAIAPDWGYRTLLVGLSLCALLWSLAQFLPTKTVSPNQATSWITGIGSAVILLSFKGLIVEESLYWSAGAIMVLSASTALLARWRAEELWAFISTLAMSLAVSLIVWEINPGHSNAQLWVYLLQANATVFAVLSLLWSLETWERKTLFTFQSWAGVSILIFLLGYALVLIVSSPDVLLPEEVQIMGYPLGWIALTLSGWAVWKRSQSDIPIMLGIMIVVMTAIVIHGQSTIPWTGLHVVQIGFAALGAFCAVSIQRRSSYLIWTQAFIWMLVGLGFRSAWTDPWQPWPGVGTALLASGLAGSIAIVLRRQSFVNLSAIFIVLSGAQFWLGGQQIITIEFIPALLIALSAAVLIWTVIELQLSKREPPYTLREDRISQPPFTHSGSWLASISLAIVAVEFSSIALLISDFSQYRLTFGSHWHCSGLDYCCSSLIALHQAHLQISISSE